MKEDSGVGYRMCTDEEVLPWYVQFLPCVVRHRDWVQVDGYEGHSYVVLSG